MAIPGVALTGGRCWPAAATRKKRGLVPTYTASFGVASDAEEIRCARAIAASEHCLIR